MAIQMNSKALGESGSANQDVTHNPNGSCTVSELLLNPEGVGNLHHAAAMAFDCLYTTINRSQKAFKCHVASSQDRDII